MEKNGKVSNYGIIGVDKWQEQERNKWPWSRSQSRGRSRSRSRNRNQSWTWSRNSNTNRQGMKGRHWVAKPEKPNCLKAAYRVRNVTRLVQGYTDTDTDLHQRDVATKWRLLRPCCHSSRRMGTFGKFGRLDRGWRTASKNLGARLSLFAL